MVTNDIPCVWTTLRLCDLGRIVTGKTPSTKVEENFGGSVPFITPTDMDGRKTISTTARYLTEQGAYAVRGSRIPLGSVMVSCIGSDLGKAAIAGQESVTNQQINSIIVGDEFDANFVYYNLSTRQDELKQSGAGGSAVPILNKGHFSELTIDVPPLIEQRAISSILGSLDDKIELNRRMNETLEGIARALFKSWFVDFDPVRAKMDGRQPAGMSPEIANLFPSELEHVNGELVPKGWTVSRISEVAEINYGKNLPGNKLLPSGIPVYGAAGLVGYYSEAMFKEPVTLVTSRGSGSGVVHQTFGPSFVTNNSFTVVPRQQWLGRHYLRHALLNADILSLVTGSAQPQLTVTNFSYLNLLIPAQEIARKFDSSLEVLWKKATSNNFESEKLASLRDTLLPKLLSGELRVPEAGQMLEEVL